MSWISDLAGKAENLLNQIDQNAAQVLQQPPGAETSLATVAQKASLKLSSTTSPSKSPARKPAGAILKISSKSDLENLSVKSEPISNISSRRSSVSSKADEDTVVTANLQLNSNQELAAFKIALAEIKTERDELKLEVAQLQQELKTANASDLIAELQLQIEEILRERDILNGKLQQSTESNEASRQEIEELRQHLSSNRQNFIELNEKFQWQTKEVDQRCTELEQYRKKAQITLQAKDRLIEELKKGSTVESPEHSTERVLQFEIESLQQDNLMKANELLELQSQLEHSKLELQRYVEQLSQIQGESNQEKQFLQNNLRIESDKMERCESEFKILNQEMLAIRQESNRQNQMLLDQLHQKQQDLVKQRLKYEKSAESEIDGSIEARMQSLTQALVQKQAAIETVTAEKNAMKLQLERIEDQLRHVVAQNRPQRNQIINVNYTDDAKASLPFIMRENPFDTRVTRRVKRAYSSLDSLGFRIGIFLRRFPLARVLIIIYVALLHLFVMFVLLSSTPT